MSIAYVQENSDYTITNTVKISQQKGGGKKKEDIYRSYAGTQQEDA